MRRATSVLPVSLLRQLPSPALKVISAAGAAFVVTALLPAVSSQAAQPKTVAEAQARVDQLNEQAEVITEQYNAAQAQLGQASQRAAAATAAAKRAQARVADARAAVSAFAAQTYESGGAAQTMSAVLATGDPGVAMAKLAALQQIGSTKSAALTKVRAAGQRYQQALAVASQASARAKDINTRLAKQKQQIDGLLAQSRHVLATLTAAQRAQMLAAQRAKAAAALAAARAAQAPLRASRSITRPADPAPVAMPQTAGGSSVAARAVAAAMSKLGRPYVWGAAGPNSFDCSGLVQWAYRQAGVSTAHYTGAFWNAYRHVSQGDLRPGDLVFFYADYHHIGIYIGGGMMVDAPQTGDVVKVQSVAGHGSYRGAVRVVG